MTERERLKLDLSMARAALKMCPKKNGEGFTSVEIRTARTSVKLDAEARANIERKIELIKARLAQLPPERRASR